MKQKIFILGASILFTGCVATGPSSENLNGFSVNYRRILEQFSNQDILQNVLSENDGLSATSSVHACTSSSVTMTSPEQI
jgi:hypothetical protein